MKKRAFAVIGAIAIAAVSLGACSQGGTSAQNSSNNNDVQTSATALQQLQRAQPTPMFQWSQLRQTLISIETAQADNTQTTTFFFNQGVQDPISSCPSIGFPVASTTELTNPLQNDGQGGQGAGAVIGQVDPTGVYSGSSTGTYVVCISANGGNYVQYWEGFVDNVTGPAVWNTTTHQVQLTGPSTTTVKTKPGA